RRHTRFSRDWSSDVCSSDLDERRPARGDGADEPRRRLRAGAGGGPALALGLGGGAGRGGGLLLLVAAVELLAPLGHLGVGSFGVVAGGLLLFHRRQPLRLYFAQLRSEEHTSEL